MRLIDADAFKEYICNAYEQVKHMYRDGGKWAKEITEAFCKDIDEQPTIEPQKWIPVSERLPIVGQNVLLSIGKGMTTAEGCLRDDGDWCQFRWETIWAAYYVDAWMPLPEPYKEDD